MTCVSDVPWTTLLIHNAGVSDVARFIHDRVFDVADRE